MGTPTSRPLSVLAIVGTLLLPLLPASPSRACWPEPTLLGTWQDIAKRDHFIRFEDRSMARSKAGELLEIVRIAAIKPDRIILDHPVWPRDVRYTLGRTRLIIVDEHAGGERTYERVADKPYLFEWHVLDLSPRGPLSPERVTSITDELARRLAADQAMRQKKPWDPAEAARVDADNVAWLKGVIAETGWIDTERFGPQAAYGASMIVQHSLDYDLVASVLAWVEMLPSPDFQLSYWHALVRDRFQLMIGERQRYGTQSGRNAEGRIIMFPIESVASADRYWRSLGMRTGVAAVAGVNDVSEIEVLEYGR